MLGSPRFGRLHSPSHGLKILLLGPDISVRRVDQIVRVEPRDPICSRGLERETSHFHAVRIKCELDLIRMNKSKNNVRTICFQLFRHGHGSVSDMSFNIMKGAIERQIMILEVRLILEKFLYSAQHKIFSMRFLKTVKYKKRVTVETTYIYSEITLR